MIKDWKPLAGRLITMFPLFFFEFSNLRALAAEG